MIWASLWSSAQGYPSFYFNLKTRLDSKIVHPRDSSLPLLPLRKHPPPYSSSMPQCSSPLTNLPPFPSSPFLHLSAVSLTVWLGCLPSHPHRPTPPNLHPSAPSPPFLSLPTAVSTCPSSPPTHLRSASCRVECRQGTGCLPDSRDKVLNPVAVFPGPASSDGLPNP